MELSTSLFAEDRRPLEEIFPHRDPAPDLPLPPAFDDTCRRCTARMARMDPVYFVRRKPYATFQCTNDRCMERLFIFDAPRAPFIIWSSSCRHWIDFSRQLDEAIEQREIKHAARST